MSSSSYSNNSNAFEDHMNYLKSIFDEIDSKGIKYEEFKNILKQFCFITFEKEE